MRRSMLRRKGGFNAPRITKPGAAPTRVVPQAKTPIPSTPEPVAANAENTSPASTPSPTPAPVQKPAAPRRRGFRAPTRTKPLASTTSTTKSSSSSYSTKPESKEDRYFTVLYCKRSNKKHKSYNDGVIAVCGRKCQLFNMENKLVVKRTLSCRTDYFGAGSEFDIGGWEAEVVAPLPVDEFLSGRCFVDSGTSSSRAGGGGGGVSSAPTFRKKRRKGDLAPKRPLSLTGGAVRASSALKVGASKLPNTVATLLKRARHDATSDQALVLNARRSVDMWKELPEDSPATSAMEVPVVVDPHLSRILRPHQVEGVRFLYESIVQGGAQLPTDKDQDSNVCLSGRGGAILADEMGLGKTLQAITLLWTLLQSGPRGAPHVTKAIVVTPSSLTRNWDKEFRKWLGSSRLRVLVMSSSMKAREQKEMVKNFVNARTYPVLVIGYEMLRKHSKTMASLHKLLIVCDEGHRLKNSGGNKTISALTQLQPRARLLLTGTPVQNNLDEFFAMCDFVNPGILGSLSSFRNTFASPISKSRDANCNARDRVLGEARSRELTRITTSFVLRRTADVLRKFLPPRTECVLFTPLTPMQTRIYKVMCGSKAMRRFLARQGSASDVNPLQIVTSLKKLCNHPSLMYQDCRKYVLQDADGDTTMTSEQALLDAGDSIYADALRAFPDDFDAHRDFSDPTLSGKLACLAALLESLRVSSPTDKLVLVSNYCQTLDVLESLCNTRLGLATFRLDGSTPSNARQELVDRFNRPESKEQVFLLSSQAGGVGFNLIGANRLVLFDGSWNPAHDKQAMARVWRDGQKKSVYIYRLLATGSIDEKIFQRQIRKLEVADRVVDDRRDVKRNFSGEMLKELFVLHSNTKCETYDIMMEKNTTGSKRKKRSSSSSKSKAATKKRKVQEVEDDEDVKMSSSSEAVEDGEEEDDDDDDDDEADGQWQFFEDHADVADAALANLDEGITTFVMTKTSMPIPVAEAPPDDDGGGIEELDVDVDLEL